MSTPATESLTRPDGELLVLFVGVKAPPDADFVRYVRVDAAEAVDASRRERPSVIVIDERRVDSAEELIHRVGRYAPVAVLIDNPATGHVAELLAAGATEAIAGTVSASELQVGIRSAISRHRQSGEQDDRIADPWELDGIARAIHDGLVITDLGGRIRFVNPVAEKLFGRTEQQMLGTHFGYPVVEDVSVINLLVEMDGNLSGRAVEVRCASIIRGGREECLIVLHDITDRRQAEESLRGLSALAASHELREPLRALAGCSRVLATRYRAGLDERGQELIDHIQAGVARLDELMNAVFTYTRVGFSGRVRHEVDLGQLVDAVTEELSYELGAIGGTVSRTDLPTLSIDREQVQLLFRNLLSNAIKFRSEADLEVSIAAELVEGEWTFSVTDNGIGIPEEHRSDVFALFRRLHSSSEYQGSGVGMAIGRKVVEAHGGRMWIEDGTRGGVSIRFALTPTRYP